MEYEELCPTVVVRSCVRFVFVLSVAMVLPVGQRRLGQGALVEGFLPPVVG